MKSFIFFFITIFFVFYGCKKDKTITLPIGITTEKADIINSETVAFHGAIEGDGGSPIIEKGFCWGDDSLPTILNSKIIVDGVDKQFDCSLIISESNKTYFVRSFATNSKGTIYGNEVHFLMNSSIQFNSNLIYNNVKDNEGSNVNTIKIGSQTWMAENLKTKHYNNGDPITTYDGSNKNSAIQLPCNNNEENVETYGRLYTFYVVEDTRGVCPTGWSIPTFSDWNTLIDYCGEQSYSTILKMSEEGHLHWTNTSINNSNEKGFTALPSGYLDGYLGLTGLNSSCEWWTSSSFENGGNIFYESVRFNDNIMYMGTPKNNAFSIRCIKD